MAKKAMSVAEMAAKKSPKKTTVKTATKTATPKAAAKKSTMLDSSRAQMTKLVDKYCRIAGMSSREENVRREFVKDLKGYADEFKQDGLGSIAAYKKGTDKNGPVIMLAGHMDEIGLMVTKIDDKGFVSFNTVGG